MPVFIHQPCTYWKWRYVCILYLGVLPVSQPEMYNLFLLLSKRFSILKIGPFSTWDMESRIFLFLWKSLYFSLEHIYFSYFNMQISINKTMLLKNGNKVVWKCDSAVEHLPCMCETIFLCHEVAQITRGKYLYSICTQLLSMFTYMLSPISFLMSWSNLILYVNLSP